MPIQDANSVALKLVQAAGPNGGVVLNFTPDQALLILQAVQKQGLEHGQGVGVLDAVQLRLRAQRLSGPAWDGILASTPS